MIINKTKLTCLVIIRSYFDLANPPTYQLFIGLHTIINSSQKAHIYYFVIIEIGHVMLMILQLTVGCKDKI